MAGDTYHEPYAQLSEASRDMHRALVSLVEEIEAIDWYAQRAEATSDPELREVLLHNRGEEIEHAMMNLEWIRRHDPKFDATIRTYLGTDVPIVSIEKSVRDKRAAGQTSSETNPPIRGLGIGSLKGR